MDVILLERIEKLGAIGDVVTVKNGFARNFLLPQNKALLANAANKARFEAEREHIEARNAAAAEEARKSGENLDGAAYVIIRQSSDTGFLYGSVSARDISDYAKSLGHPIERNQVDLNQPFKKIGLYEVKVRLHAEVVITITVNIARSEEEAERQVAGENVIEATLEAERAEADAQAQEMARASREAAAQRGDVDEEL
ncbi:50S ribosomal protein L9 [Hirschia baltica]|uniref:Large ribosomal subunit protein bL9 n=1 Tax=Hirschia baltica (strain ATCC 49814 / DSM 5838 / IFAM 1418) TaxID=582402 RepID=C6XKR0_HIRBI|nr:50S ribosomal protein L9 [Hirschia baltica]ACT59627.1 ribosomal protein L9 [Hirschia baltica ATCC 49814]